MKRMRHLVVAYAAAVLVATVPVPAIAGDSPCSAIPKAPWTDGVNMFFESTGYCPEWGPFAVESQAKLRERSLGIWFWRDTKTNWSAPVTVLWSGRGAYNCNGHGTDDWQTRGRVEDTKGNWDYGWSAVRSLTC